MISFYARNIALTKFQQQNLNSKTLVHKLYYKKVSPPTKLQLLCQKTHLLYKLEGTISKIYPLMKFLLLGVMYSTFALKTTLYHLLYSLVIVSPCLYQDGHANAFCKPIKKFSEKIPLFIE